MTRAKLKKQSSTGIPAPRAKLIDHNAPSPEVLRHSEIRMIPPAKYSTDVPVPRREGMHDRLVDAGKITPEAWDWVDRYCEALEIVNGGASPSSEKVDGGSIGSGIPYALQDHVVRAVTRVRLGDDRMTPPQRALVHAACVDAWAVADVAERILLRPVNDGEDRRAYKDRVKGFVEREVVRAINAGAGIKKN